MLDGCCLRLVLVGFVGLRWWLVVVIVLVRCVLVGVVCLGCFYNCGLDYVL